MRTITVEEHYATAAFMDGPGRQLAALADSVRAHPQVAAGYELLIKQLCDLGDGRIAAMDAAGIDVQVLSLTSPGAEQLDAAEAVAFAAATNDCLAAAVRRHPARFAGFAALPTSAPDAAADELERTVRAYGFKGALINGHSRGRYLDDEFFWPILQRAEALQVPLYLHPTPPPQSVIKDVYAGNYEPDVTSLLATAAWGWHIDTAIHVLRLILSGAFDRFPDLQLIIGHLGEALPFMLPRLELALPVSVTKLQRPVGAYLRENLHYSVSGFNWTQAFLDLLLQVGADRIMFSDRPPLRVHGTGARVPGSPAGQHRRPGPHRAHQRRAAPAAVTRAGVTPPKHHDRRSQSALCARSHIVFSGTSSGIGRAAALDLAAAGHHVFAGIRQPGDARCRTLPARARSPLLLDVTDPAQIGAAAAPSPATPAAPG